MAAIGKDIDQAAAILQMGGLVAIPTETVYGLAANAFDSEAVVKIFATKNRPAFDPLITHVANSDQLAPLVSYMPAVARQLMQAYWPGPLTLVLPKTHLMNDLVTSGLPTAAFRQPRHPLLQQLLSIVDFPLVAPSANPFGYVSPTTPQHVEAQLGDKIDYILDGGPCQIGVESTIVGFEGEQPVVLRLGGLPVEDIEKVAGKVMVKPHSTSRPQAPGMLESHYAPQSCRVIVGELPPLIKKYKHDRIGILSFSRKYADYPNFVLSERGDLNEAASRLFSALRWFDRQQLAYLLAEPVPDTGLGRAINDRLRRAAT